MKTLGFGLLIVLGLAMVVVATVVYTVQNHQVDRDTGGWLRRAQVAANADDMHEYLFNLKEGIEKRGMMEGHASLLWLKPENDMSRVYQTVVEATERAEQLKGLPKDDTTYQVGLVSLEDLRGSLQNLELHNQAYYWRHDGWPLISLIIVFWVLGSIFLLTGILGSIVFWEE